MLEKIQITIIVLLIPLGAFFWYTSDQNIHLRDFFVPTTKVAKIGEITVRVDIANTDEERIKGLSGKTEIGNVNGLLFVFPEAGYHGIWMKDMKFAIDVIWIGPDLTVVGVERDVLPNTYPKTFRPDVPVQYIIETEARYTDTMGIQAGQKVQLPERYLED